MSPENNDKSIKITLDDLASVSVPDVALLPAAIRPLVLDAHIRKLHVILDHGQPVRGSPRADLLGRPIRASVRPPISSVVLL